MTKSVLNRNAWPKQYRLYRLYRVVLSQHLYHIRVKKQGGDVTTSLNQSLTLRKPTVSTPHDSSLSKKRLKASQVA